MPVHLVRRFFLGLLGGLEFGFHGRLWAIVEVGGLLVQSKGA